MMKESKKEFDLKTITIGSFLDRDFEGKKYLITTRMVRLNTAACLEWSIAKRAGDQEAENALYQKVKNALHITDPDMSFTMVQAQEEIFAIVTIKEVGENYR